MTEVPAGSRRCSCSFHVAAGAGRSRQARLHKHKQLSAAGGRGGAVSAVSAAGRAGGRGPEGLRPGASPPLQPGMWHAAATPAPGTDERQAGSAESSQPLVPRVGPAALGRTVGRRGRRRPQATSGGPGRLTTGSQPQAQTSDV